MLDTSYGFWTWLQWIHSINPFPKRPILDSSKLKRFADDNFEFDKNGRKFSKWVENTVGKGQIARYSFSHSVFKRHLLQTRKKQRILDSSAPPRSLSGVLDSWPGDCKFDTQLSQTLSPAHFRLSPLLRHVRKLVRGFGKELV